MIAGSVMSCVRCVVVRFDQYCVGTAEFVCDVRWCGCAMETANCLCLGCDDVVVLVVVCEFH